ncbi:helix-turn-helix transcriptional regulator [Streptomyces sp. NPDC101145]|uniref:helix-turn-helix transcriptional regulator n=1 Tax=Streptomyces sp. NPDC101145 TaxID=3366112 RepID=UPI003818D54D
MDLTGYLTSDEAAERLGINRQSLYNLANRSPDFPKPKKVGRTSLWPEQGVDEWRAKHPKRQISKNNQR